jgi:type VI secretion system protein ImpK
MVSAMERPTNLLTLFNDLLVLGTSLKTAVNSGEPEGLRSHLLDMFYQVNQLGNDMGIPKETMRLARYAVAAYLDEMIMTSQWPKKHQWPAMSLQNELFSTDTAGQGFFKHLEEIWRGHPLNTDLLELYYHCLVLGFEGKYKLQGRDQLKALIQEMGRDLQVKRGEVPPLSLGESSRGTVIRNHQQATIPWILSAAGIVLATGLYAILMMNISWDAEAVATHLKELTEKVTQNR